MACFLTSAHIAKRATRAMDGPHPLSRPTAKRLRARFAHVLHAFFVRQAPKMIGQVLVLRGKQPFVKAALTQDEQDALDTLVATLDFAGWAVLAGDVDGLIEEITNDGATVALARLGIDVTAKPEIADLVNQEALNYASERSAAMVGMRRTATGMVPNPKAEWQITEGTREFLKGDIRQALEEGWSNDVLASKLANNYAFSDSRAMTIARTETIRASNQGALASYAASGVVEAKEWTTAEDDRVSEDCEENGDAGPIALDAAFPSGDDAPPAHPNCRCVIVPVVTFASEQPTTTEEEA
jgi:SPP1 gp7 family putative phage head morphogenesis protein